MAGTTSKVWTAFAKAARLVKPAIVAAMALGLLGILSGPMALKVRAATTETIQLPKRFDDQPGGPSRGPSISADGRYIVFATLADNLAPAGRGLIIYDRTTNTLSNIATTVNPTQDRRLAISGDGRWIAFETFDSRGRGVAVFDQQSGTTEFIEEVAWPDISADGRFIAAETELSDVEPGVNGV